MVNKKIVQAAIEAAADHIVASFPDDPGRSLTYVLAVAARVAALAGIGATAALWTFSGLLADPSDRMP